MNAVHSRAGRARIAPFVLAALISHCGGDDEPCDRQGCDAMLEHARDDGHRRLVGAVGGLSDTPSETCAECGLASGIDIQAWALTDRVEGTVYLEEFQAKPLAGQTKTDRGHYELALPAGLYLVCVMWACYNVPVSEHTTTFNMLVTAGGGIGHLAEGDAYFQQVAALRVR